ncbi:MAG: hypothetical protein ABSD68_03210 [Candidatus Micrarchaeales archaeon]|jgi:DNA-directed RNA polymerase subunit L
MHLYNIRTKDGTEYSHVLLTDERGAIGNVLASILRDDPRIHIAKYTKEGQASHSIKLLEIESAVCEQERVDAGPLRDVDELPRWLELYKVYVAHKKEIDALQDINEKTRVARELIVELKRNL